jgi:nitroimidazol reductase NimA-like FMN-containing flavoprotein (pyridoxamine 5'-phosphate oxidase superfamily)
VTEAGAWDFLAGRELGRLAVCAAGILDFYSVASVVDQHSIVFLAAPGKKLLELTVHDPVVFEADFYDELFSKSVAIHGRATRVETMAESAAAWLSPPPRSFPPQEGTVHIVPTSITGQVFRRSR